MKERIDITLVKNGLVRSRNVAVELIKSGFIFVNGKVVKKPSEEFGVDIKIEVKNQPRFVSRAGEKLEKAIIEFNFDLKDKIVLDIGSSTGGFTDCVLQNGAEKVFAVDVGTNQLVKEIRENPKVISLEKTDIRKLEQLPENTSVDIAVIDVSFISLTLVLPHIKKFLKPDAKIITLVKPQFELSPADINKSGIVRTPELQIQALQKIISWCPQNGFQILAQTDSPILGNEGNKEYLLYIKTQS